MSDVVIRAEGLGKSYRLRHQQPERYVALRDVLAAQARALGGWLSGGKRAPSESEEEFWALRDVSFELRRGEVLGIIGRNGAGKSTLLKILSRITEPTEGRVRIRGRVASLLEVGTGFHPELSGRENIFVNGAILGMSRAEVKRKFDEIVAFAEVEKFLDTPVKRYSSGMYVRLAFAVAAHLEPDILVVDEVLAVGDTEFQQRCLGKLRSVATAEGRTVLFVSHNMSAIQSLCDRTILFREGRVAVDGATPESIKQYLGELVDSGGEFARKVQVSGKPTIIRGSIDPFDHPGDVYVECWISSKESKSVSLDIRLIDQSGQSVAFGSLGALGSEGMVRLSPGENHVSLWFTAEQLAVGTYFMSLDLTVPNAEYIDRVESCLRFEVTRGSNEGHGRALEQSWGYGCYELPIQRCEAESGSNNRRG